MNNAHAAISHMPNRTNPEVEATDLIDPFVPSFPEKIEQLDVSPGFLTDLALKHVSLEPDCTTAQIAERMKLGKIITDNLLQGLTHEKFIEMKGVSGLHNHRYDMLERGWEKVQRLMSVSSYAGPTPVSLDSYTKLITKQVRSRPAVQWNFTKFLVDRSGKFARRFEPAVKPDSPELTGAIEKLLGQ